jgi:ABC-type lipoprotein export system ATPase subunit
VIAAAPLLNLHHSDMPGETLPNALELRAVRCTRNGVHVGPVSVGIPADRFTVFRGAEGSGTELLLRILGLLETADQGEVFVKGKCLSIMDEEMLAELRRRHFGYLFAAPFLLPAFTVLENVVMPMFKVLDSGPAEARLRAEELLRFVGVEQYEQAPAGELSFFEQRCVALARALATEPAVLLVENFDAELPFEQQRQFARLLRETCQRWRTTIVATVSPTWMPAAGDHVFEVTRGNLELAPAPLPQS